MQAQHVHRGTYSNCTPTTSNTESGFFGISGFNISCIANYDNARIDFYLGSSDTKKNKEAFDLLYSHKNDIEEELGVTLDWDRADSYKASWMCYCMNDVSITNEADWPRIAKFHAEWSDKINGFYPAKTGKEEWLWRTPYRTSNISIPEDLSKYAIFTSLDSCMDEILAFEADLTTKLNA